MKPMLLTSSNEIPSGDNWVFEPKYDGFRCILQWEENKSPLFISRNGKKLNNQFPEIISFCDEIEEKVKPYLPLILDGELVHLKNDVRSDFNIVQTRGRMRKKDVITSHSLTFPCQFVAFDLIVYKGKEVASQTLTKRKQLLKSLFNSLLLPYPVQFQRAEPIQGIQTFEENSQLWTLIKNGNGEGLIAKKKTSKWENGQRTADWLKIKNWRFISVFLSKYDKSNGFFHGAIYEHSSVKEIVIFRHGLTEEEEKTLITLFQTNGSQVSLNVWSLPPSICVTIACIDFDGKHLREPRFHSFDLDKEPEQCNWSTLQRQLYPLPEKIELTHPDKPLWPSIGIKKDDYILYLQKSASYLLPFLYERLLTVIRYPHGMLSEEKFYQKNRPDYTPAFVSSYRTDDIDYIVCNDLETLLWLGNQLALEFHIPFQTVKSLHPTEIVFDLDPPSVNEFSLAIEAALRMKEIFDKFELPSFIKTSGGKGLQIYIPLQENAFTYQETRVFTEFVCTFLCEQFPAWFTTERLKKNRGNRLYLDYIQHDKGKTIIAPYSPRGNEKGLVATPLTWDEVNNGLKPDLFTIPSVLERLQAKGDPFHLFRKDAVKDSFEKVLDQLSTLLNR
nr:DNA ligase D [Halalkalibacter urbisdiaboli]